MTVPDGETRLARRIREIHKKSDGTYGIPRHTAGTGSLPRAAQTARSGGKTPDLVSPN